MQAIVTSKKTLFLAPLTFLLLGSGCERNFGEPQDCWIDSSYQIKCDPIDPEPPITDLVLR